MLGDHLPGMSSWKAAADAYGLAFRVEPMGPVIEGAVEQRTVRAEVLRTGTGLQTRLQVAPAPADLLIEKRQPHEPPGGRGTGDDAFDAVARASGSARAITIALDAPAREHVLRLLAPDGPTPQILGGKVVTLVPGLLQADVLENLIGRSLDLSEVLELEQSETPESRLRDVFLRDRCAGVRLRALDLLLQELVVDSEVLQAAANDQDEAVRGRVAVYLAGSDRAGTDHPG